MKKKEECKKHDKESECGDCGKKFYLIPKNESSDFTTKNNWKENLKPRVSSLFPLNEGVEEFAEDILELYWQKIEPAIENLLQQARQEERELIKKEIEKEYVNIKTTKTLSFMEMIGYNKAVDDIINNLL